MKKAERKANIAKITAEKRADLDCLTVEQIGDRAVSTLYRPEKLLREVSVEAYIKGETVSQRQRDKASQPRKPVTKAQLEAHREKFHTEWGTYRGWKNAASIDLSIDVKTITKRMKE
jgi:hypothetical protein